MNPSPLDLQRLAVRVETMERASTHGWRPADEMEFNGMLPTPLMRSTEQFHGRRLSLVSAGRLRNGEHVTVREYQDCLSLLQRMEGLIRDNDRFSPKRIMWDMARGRIPRC